MTDIKSVSLPNELKDIKKIFIYCRVSTEKQIKELGEFQSLDSQWSRCDRFIKENFNKATVTGLREVCSASHVDNQDLEHIINKNSKMIIMVADLTRLSRNTTEFKRLFNKALKKKIYFATIGSAIVYHTSWETLFPLIKMSEEEGKLIRDRLTASRLERKAKGAFIGGRVAFGYRLEKNDEGLKFLEPDDREQSIIRLIEVLNSEGTHIDEVSSLLTEITGENVEFKLYDWLGNTPNESKSEYIDGQYNVERICEILEEYGITARGKNIPKAVIKKILDRKLFSVNPEINEEEEIIEMMERLGSKRKRHGDEKMDED